MGEKKIVISEERELRGAAVQILPLISDFPIVCLNGEMGAGKTTFVKKICEQLGVADTMGSPTFSIINEYRDRGGAPVYHFDFYRVNNLEEALEIGTEEYFYSGNLCLIEWAGTVNELIPDKHLEIDLKIMGDNKREMTIRPYWPIK